MHTALHNNIETYINYHKIHTMAMHYGGVGDTSMENAETQDLDNDSQDNFQDENIVQQLICKTECLKQAIEDKDNDPRDAIHQLEQRQNQLTLTLHPPSEPIEEVLDKYTETLCNTQKKKSLESSLLQDILTLNGQDSSQLEDWLPDIETASELTGESRTKLAQAKSRGIVRTLISEAFTAQKTWEEIKDCLCLKISNTDIHTSISHFMDIQQSDKESLAAYVHHFKWEANSCKFNNDTATIRIFLKGLKNAHNLATKVYEIGPQSLAETIKEVEKLQAAQQMASTLIHTSSVNTMSSDNDKCFQCQETGHMAHYCPHIRCFDSNNYGHVAMDCPDEILPSGTPACHRDNTTSRHDRSSSRHHSHTRCSHHDYGDRHRFSHSQSHSHNLRYRSNSHHDSHKSCSRLIHRPSHHSSSLLRSSNTYHCCCNTPHCRSSSHRNFSQDDSRPRMHKSHKQHYKPA